MIPDQNQKIEVHKLLDKQNKKPIDTGCGSLSASISDKGLLRSLNSVHSEQGYITLNSIDPFPNDKWFDSKFVREYRTKVADLHHSGDFGISTLTPPSKTNIYYVNHTIPLFVHEYPMLRVFSLFLSKRVNNQSYLIHHCIFKSSSDQLIEVPFQISGKLNLNRSSYGQLTEGGPVMMPENENYLKISGHQMDILNPNLPARVRILLFDGTKPLLLPDCEMSSSKPLFFSHNGSLRLSEKGRQTISMIYSFDPITDAGIKQVLLNTQSRVKAINWEVIIHEQSTDPVKNETLIIQRNIDYIRSCCSVPIGNDVYCVITDHQLLPLSWNRDAYYMMKLLVLNASEERAKHLESAENDFRIVKGHITWMFQTAERPNGYWGRAYFTNGKYKDGVFQLDQQCYPLLELCDYYQTTNDDLLVNQSVPAIREILNLLLDYKAQDYWLFGTGETPADDHVAYPYHFSSQVLLWKTLTELDKLNKRFSFYKENLSDWASRIKKDTIKKFSALIDDKRVFAYLTDLRGNDTFYHDANDLPTVLAPIWNFCKIDDECWLNTMQFAFSEKNKGGYYSGKFGGLGSLHTPHPWPLGSAQQLIFFYLTKNRKLYIDVLEKIERLVQWDGLFPEAINEQSGEVESRQWFSWPGAFISLFLLFKKNKHALLGDL
ncbi:metal-independent alpha-mannosidase [Sporolactobacillus shoreae]|uniref:Metal-independent alpha-mannosidase n=1 Tax=Sporolactobacillus shoreae TaxID=1465501 RepID=A0A4Z0GU48_9BACL|nr:glycoside hydrolase family 125 protein [Sporolactobacillus shoreae]TGA99832.1 metal-independent alpha-mannosidase [Sporolactobacillus shoreae]